MGFYPSYNRFTAPVTFVSDGTTTPPLTVRGLTTDPLKQLVEVFDGFGNPIESTQNAGGAIQAFGDKGNFFNGGDVVNPRVIIDPTAAQGLVKFGTGGAADASLQRIQAAMVGSLDSDIVTDLVGKGFRVKEGTNGKMGVATLAAGAVTVANTSVTAASRIFVTSNTDGGTPGAVRVSVITAGVSFTITSTNGADTSTVAWLIFQPAP